MKLEKSQKSGLVHFYMGGSSISRGMWHHILSVWASEKSKYSWSK